MDLSAFRIDGVTYEVAGHTILSDVDASIGRHTLTGLVGPNGAGKTTLLRLLNGLRRPSRGRILFGGQDVSALPERERARKIALVPQNPSVGFGFTVYDIVAMGRHPYNSRLAPLSIHCRCVIDRAVHLTQIEGLLDRRITDLSGGERQRVFLARALAQEPSVLLLDEPTANLDVRYQLEVFELIERLQSEHELTVVMAVHDLTWALRYCSHVLVLSRGRLVASGEASSVLTEQLVRDVFQVQARVVQAERRVDIVSL